MAKSDPEEIVALIDGIADLVKRLQAISDQFPDELRMEFRRHLATIIEKINADILTPIFEQHVELDRDAVELFRLFGAIQALSSVPPLPLP